MRTVFTILAIILNADFYTILLVSAIWCLAILLNIIHRKAFILLIVNR